MSETLTVNWRTFDRKQLLDQFAQPELLTESFFCFRRETFITGPSSQLPQMEEEEEEEADLRTPARLDSAQGEEEEDGGRITESSSLCPLTVKTSTLCLSLLLLPKLKHDVVSGPPPLQTNGKLPMWFRRLVSSLSTVSLLIINLLVD